METLTDIWDSVSVSAIVQVAILYVVIYAILKSSRGSRFGQVLTGVGMLAAFLVAFSIFFRFDVLSRIVQFLLVYLAISTVVIFQPEIRRMLSTVGAFGFFERAKRNPDGSATPGLVIDTIMRLSDARMGALVAFERSISLRGYESTGVTVNADFSDEIVRCIFTPPLPLHDGGMTIRHGRIAAAHCIFPVSNNPALLSSGMRHRAALGLSEETDALVIVVSEETGAISVARNGRLYRYSGAKRRAQVTRWITSALSTYATERGIFNILLDRLVRRFQSETTTEREKEPEHEA